jgi:predicted HTH transcriptional regulator
MTKTIPEIKQAEYLVRITDILKIIAANPGCTTQQIAQSLPSYSHNIITASIVRMEAVKLISCQLIEGINRWYIADWFKS